ncbi:4a-hydroxytetrahydrobiopterin dehydratase [Cohnella sp. CIP 111063]|uniref:4a-hydroxytetrahydrobiopterin dehydratase n=1 Tax=unclassified Cohnella TaxID=2636738 RepID=UPI000B8C1B5E|nr:MULTISPECIES: 4a-hydroxytetrahydrobiopterin dehydratase [unclassified Cohnella]OXS52947.1 4a-hydroxytetrahydrobiopterin dehydratase [Cohnella sp. CIP 111063]PRX60202.1 pterin-4-alpha-carbinolamine dehydratase [Cohnella sp. SGD-V74]
MGKRPLLTEKELEEALLQLEGWKVEEDGKWLVRKRVFPSFMEAIAFVGKVAAIAEEHNHHPLIGIDYKRVTLRLTTWHSGGLTSLDVESALAYDRL